MSWYTLRVPFYQNGQALPLRERRALTNKVHSAVRATGKDHKTRREAEHARDVVETLTVVRLEVCEAEWFV